jgi:putative aminopeptidase FrvX
MIQKTGNGVPVINVVVPTRFTHSHNSIINRADFDRTVDLLVAVIESLDTSAVAGLHDFSAGAGK